MFPSIVTLEHFLWTFPMYFYLCTSISQLNNPSLVDTDMGLLTRLYYPIYCRPLIGISWLTIMRFSISSLVSINGVSTSLTDCGTSRTLTFVKWAWCRRTLYMLNDIQVQVQVQIFLFKEKHNTYKMETETREGLYVPSFMFSSLYTIDSSFVTT